MNFKKKIKIVFVFGALGAGGAQRQFGILLTEIDRSKFDPHVYSIGITEQEADHHLEKYPEIPEHESRIHSIEMSRYFLYRKLKGKLPIRFIPRTSRYDVIKPVKLIADYLRQDQPDIVFCINPLAGFYGRIAARLAGIGTVIQGVRSIEKGLNRKGPPWIHLLKFRIRDHILARFTTLYVGNSKDVIQGLISSGTPEAKARVIYNGIPTFYDPTEETPEKLHDVIHVGIVGRLYASKDHDTFLRAVASIQCESPVRYLIIGTGPEEDRLKAKVVEMNLQEKVVFTGWVQDVSAILKELDIVVLTSITEGLSSSIAEAQMHGLPVVTTDAPGCSEIVVDGETGYIHPIGADQLIAGSIKKLIENPELRKRFGDNAFSRMRNEFSIPAMVRAYESLFMELVQM